MYHYSRDRRLSHSLEPHFRQAIVRDRQGLDLAVQSIWAGYRQCSIWDHEAPPNDCWFKTTTAAEANQESQCVQFNILEGRLLIDGKPLGRLPQSFVSNATYSRVLGCVSKLILGDWLLMFTFM